MFLTERIAGEPFRFFADCDTTEEVCEHIVDVMGRHFWIIVRDLFETTLKDRLDVDHQATMSVSGKFAHKVHVHVISVITFSGAAVELVTEVQEKFMAMYREKGGTYLTEAAVDKIFDKSVRADSCGSPKGYTHDDGATGLQ